ncbi:Shikimate kinase 1 [compost metagenome]
MAQVDLVHVELKDLVLGELGFDLERQQQFVELARIGLFGRQVEVAGDLHRDRAGALRLGHADQVGQARAHHPHPVDPAVLIEAVVFGGKHRGLHDIRDLVEAQHIAALFAELADQHAVRRVDAQRHPGAIVRHGIQVWQVGPGQCQRHSREQDAAQEQAGTEDAGFYEESQYRGASVGGLVFLGGILGLAHRGDFTGISGPASSRGIGFCNKIVQCGARATGGRCDNAGMNFAANSCPEADPDPAPSDGVPESLPCAVETPVKAVSLPHDLPVFLVGMMGAGKTTIGRSLARALGREFMDLDHELEARCGVRVPVIFEIEGEAGFRRRESAALEECTQRRDIILATGGGAILAAENRQMLHERGIVVYLRASVDELFRRTCRDRNRPLLATADPRGTLRDLMTLREPLYKEVADLVVETGSMPIHTLVKALLPQLQAFEKRI